MSTIRQALQSALDQGGGTMPFDEFMAIALHHPGDGYYARHIRGVGPRGDFTTVPQVTPALGHALAGWLRGEAAVRGWTSAAVIECGPGDGSLAAGIMKTFGWLERRRWSLHLVETSEPLRAQQQAKLGARAVWHRTMGEALAACHGRALIYHNEFFDAFPCRVFRRDPDGWMELHLRVAEGKLAEVFLPPQRPHPDATAFAGDWPDGQRIEVFASVGDWMCGMAPAWREGAMLAIDYGGSPQEIYHRRTVGTLRAYRSQERLTGEAVYELPGRQDITADVNFEDLARWGNGAGWITSATTPLTTIAPKAPGAEAFRAIVFSQDAGGR